MDWHKAWQSGGPSDKLASIRHIKEKSDCWAGLGGAWTGKTTKSQAICEKLGVDEKVGVWSHFGSLL